MTTLLWSAAPAEVELREALKSYWLGGARFPHAMMVPMLLRDACTLMKYCPVVGTGSCNNADSCACPFEPTRSG